MDKEEDEEEEEDEAEASGAGDEGEDDDEEGRGGGNRRFRASGSVDILDRMENARQRESKHDRSFVRSCVRGVLEYSYNKFSHERFIPRLALFLNFLFLNLSSLSSNFSLLTFLF